MSLYPVWPYAVLKAGVTCEDQIAQVRNTSTTFYFLLNHIIYVADIPYIFETKLLMHTYKQLTHHHLKTCD